MTETSTEIEKTAEVPPALSAGTVRRLAAVERAAYGLGGITAAIGPQAGAAALHIGAVALGAGVLWRLWSRTRAQDASGLLTSAYRSLPTLGLSGAYTAALAAPGCSWWEIAAPLVVAGAAALATPLTRGRAVRQQAEALPQTIADQAAALTEHAPDPDAGDTGGDSYTAGIARLWAASPATGDTRLTEIRQYSPMRPDFEAVILAPPGEAVPSTLATPRAIAAVFDVPETVVSTAGVAGYGPGRLAIRVAPTLHGDAQAPAPTTHPPEETDLWEAFAAGNGHALWDAYVHAQGGAAPGVRLVAHRLENDRLTLRIAAPRGRALRLDHDALCSALGVEDTSCLVVEGAGPREAIAYVYRTNPLLTVRQPTAEDLTMDADGRISIGVCHDGRPARIMLWNPATGRAQHGLAAGTTGAGKSGLLRLLGAAERLSGIVSWMADVQGGMSLPEMDGRIDWLARGESETMAMLEAAHAVKEYREQHSAGRGDFAIGQPWPLLSISLDEINRLLSSLDTELRREAAWLVADLLKTGQKVGIGVRLGVQSLHLKELGDNHEIREKGKEGPVFLMRTASSSTRDMGLDGIAPPGAHITPIPQRIYPTASAEALFNGSNGDGVPTPGMAWLINEGRAVLMRTYVLDKQGGRYPLLEQLMDAVPMPTLTPEEIAAAGHVYQRDRTGGTSPAPAGPPQPPTNPAPATRPSPKRRATLRERIRAALTDHPEGLHLREIRRAVGCGRDGGPATGSVNNTVAAMASAGDLVACGGGVYRLP